MNVLLRVAAFCFILVQSIFIFLSLLFFGLIGLALSSLWLALMIYIYCRWRSFSEEVAKSKNCSPIIYSKTDRGFIYIIFVVLMVANIVLVFKEREAALTILRASQAHSEALEAQNKAFEAYIEAVTAQFEELENQFRAYGRYDTYGGRSTRDDTFDRRRVSNTDKSKASNSWKSQEKKIDFWFTVSIVYLVVFFLVFGGIIARTLNLEVILETMCRRRKQSHSVLDNFANWWLSSKIDKNPKVLAYLFKHVVNVNSRLEVLKGIDDQAVFREVLSSNSHPLLREVAVEKLTDQEELIRLAKEDPDLKIRQIAISKVKDQGALWSIVMKESNLELRKAALKSFNPADLFKLAQEVSDVAFRKEIVAKIENQEHIQALLKMNLPQEVACVLIAKLTDQSMLKEFVKPSSQLPVRLAALEHLEDQALLLEILKTDSQLEMRKVAIAKIKDPKSLEAFALDDTLNVVLRKNILGKITNEALLYDVVKKESDASIREMVVSKLTDPALIEMICKDTTMDIALRKKALANLNDQAIIEAIYEDKTVSLLVRKMAISRLKNLSVLLTIVREEEMSQLRATAIYRISDVEALTALLQENLPLELKGAIQKKLRSLKLKAKNENPTDEPSED